MNNPEESAVRDLCRFVENVLNGMVDEESSAFTLIRYAFNVRSVKDVIRRGSENPDLIPQIYDYIHHLVIYLNEEIIETTRNVTPVGFNDRRFFELEKRVQLMYEVWKGMQTNAAYQVPELVNHVDASREAMKYTYGICKNYHLWVRLSPEIREFFLDEKREKPPLVEDPEPTLFARDDGIVSSISHEKAQSEDEGKKKQFVAKTEKVLSNYRAKNPDYKTMRELINSNTQFRLEGIYCDSLINEIISVWDIAIDYEAENPEEKYSFTALLKKVFLMMVDKRRNDFAIKIFDKYKKDSDNVLPCLENFVENFQTGLTEAINQLPLDSNVLSNNSDLFEKAKDPIMWYLLVSPAYTVQQLSTICVDNKGYIPIIRRIFRALPTLFERSIKVTPLPFEEIQQEKLLVTILHRVFMIGRTTWTSASQWDNAGMMAMSYGKEQKRKEGQAERPEDKALIDPFTLITFALTELLKENRKPMKSVEMFVKMLNRLLANNNNTRMSTNYRFSTCLEDEGEHVVPTAIILILMFELLMEYDGQSIEVCDGARDILKSISGRMNNDGLVFDTQTSKFLTEEKFNSAPWWIKYSIYSWFSIPLQHPKRQVPSGVYKTIPEKYQDDFEQIKSEEVSTISECYLRSLFELGLFDVELAVGLLKYGYNVKFEDAAVERFALALVDSYGRRMSKRSGSMDVVKLIMAMLETFDPIRALAPLTTYCSCYLESVKKIEHILVLFMAARIAKEKQLSAARIRTDHGKQIAHDEILSLNEISEQLMDIFCESTKAHIEKEVAGVEKLRKEADKLIFSPGNSSEQIMAMVGKDEREQSLTLQLTMIYLKCSHFCRLYQQVPIKLQQLMNSTLEKQFDSQKLLAKRVMDDVLTDQRKTEVVYAFVESKDVSAEQKEIVPPVKPSELFKSKQYQSQKPAHTASNSMDNMSDINNGDNRQRRGAERETYRKNNYETDRLPTSRGNSKNHNAYRGNRWHPVNDTHAFNPRERDTIYKNTKFQSNYDSDRNLPRNDISKPSYDQEKFYYDDRRTPFKAQSSRPFDDVRRSSDSKDSNYDSSHENQSLRFPSESDYSHDDSENRLFDQTIRSVQNFSHRDSNQSFSKASTSSNSPPKDQEGKQPKTKFGEFNKFQGSNRRMYDRKPRYPSSNCNEQEEEITSKLKPGQPEREKIASALGLKNPAPNPSRRSGYNNH